MASRELYWQVMYFVLNEVFFRGYLKHTDVLQLPTDSDIELDEDCIFMNIFTNKNICQMTGILLSKMCIISSMDKEGNIYEEKLEEEYERCGFTVQTDVSVTPEERFYKSEKEYLSIYNIHEIMLETIEKQNTDK